MKEGLAHYADIIRVTLLHSLNQDDDIMEDIINISQYLHEISGRMPPVAIDVDRFGAQMIGKIEKMEECLGELHTADIIYAIVARTAKGPFSQLLEAERAKLNAGSQDEALRKDDEIDALLKGIGLERSAWNDWVDRMAGNDLEELRWDKSITRCITGNLSQLYMEVLESESDVKVLPTIITLAQRLQAAYPVCLPQERCPVLWRTAVNARIARETTFTGRLEKERGAEWSLGQPANSNEHGA